MPRFLDWLHRLVPRRFRTQIILGTLGLALFNFLLISWYIGHDFVHLQTRNTERRFNAVAGNLTIGATPLVVTKDYGSLDTMLVAAARLPGIRTLAVTDSHGHILSQVGRTEGAEPQAAYTYGTLRPPSNGDTRIVWSRHHDTGLMQFVVSGNNAVDIWKPIEHGRLGWLYLHASAREMDTEFARLSRNAFAFLLVLFLGSAALLILFLRPNLRALAQATRFARSLGSTHASRLPVYRGNLELQVLGDTLNQTARKLQVQEAALRSNQVRLSAILENLSDGLLMLDADGNIVMVNPAFCALLGVDATDAKRGGLRRYLPDLDPERDGIETVLSGYCSSLGAAREIAGRTASGERIPLAFSVSRFEVEGQTFFVGSFHDLRERNRWIAAIERARDEAISANRAKSDFLAAMSHEIRTPMNGVIGMIDLLLQSSLNARQARMAEISRASAQSLLDIINDILDHAKIEAGKLELVDGALDIERCMVEAGTLFDVLAQKKDVAFSVFVDPTLPSNLIGDELRLRQIANNLISNAIKFTAGRERPGVVSVRAELASASDGDWCRLSVADNGVGIDDEAVKRIFLPFEQAERFTTHQYGGTGLGLSICRSLVEMMHGRIDVVSRVGEGSVFTVHVPLRTDGAPRRNHGGELEGLTCTLHGGTTLMAQDVATCLQASSAIVNVAGDAQVAASPTGVDIWIGDEDAARHQAASEPGRNVLLISRGRRRSARRLSPNLVQIDGNLLTRGILAEAVRIAAHLDEEIAPQLTAPAAGPTLTREQALHEGRLILVAEDNETNQQVIRLQLEKLGWAADVVANGAEAVRRWEDGGYRLILSDLHMPTMDGFELAQAIRAREAATGRTRIPIIALTAAALPAELEHAIDAGMDDHLTKPVSLDGLRAALDQWSQSALKTRIDPSTLPALIGDDPDVLAALRRQYADELRSAIARIAEALERHDAAAVIIQAHKLKSSSRTIGAHDLGARFEALEIEGERAPAGVLETRFEALRPEAEAVLDELGDTPA